MKAGTPRKKPLAVERVQTGIRIEKRLLKVLKALAEYKSMTLGDLVEGIILHSFEGERAFSAHTLTQIENLKRMYGLDLTAANSHQLEEKAKSRPPKAGKARG